MSDQVILVNENDEQVDVMDKIEAHRQGVLHRAFSIFIFNGRGEMLLQRRAAHKYHSGGLWTNACCSHPAPGEETDLAAVRRLQEEMGFTAALLKVFDFTYRAEFDNGLTEHEYDHVYLGVYNGQIEPNSEEVSEFRHLPMEAVRQELATRPETFTAWFHIAFPLLEKWLIKNKLELQN
ncbi:MAG TPA: isopentenyl-diphosphate Delta-isomerase [Chitinophagaceae bacterium]|nr:isopentenyl-diphosphate Delta-isomerase [Chitinophagaceae bacterium]